MFSISLPKTRLPFMLLLAVQALYSVAYASTPSDTEQLGKEPNTAYNFPDSLAYDQIIARIPLAQAPIRSVALANINIALHNAKQQAEITLCDGQWAPHGSVVFQQGPVMEQSSLQTNALPSWYYHALRRPWKLDCGTSSRAAFMLEMSRYLPAWIQIRPAGQLTVFQQGETVLLKQETVAIK